MDDVDGGEFAVSFELSLQISTDEELVEALCVTGVFDGVEGDFNGGSAATTRWLWDVRDDTACTENDLIGALELHNSDILADRPEDLRRDAGARVVIPQKVRGAVRLVEAFELYG